VNVCTVNIYEYMYFYFPNISDATAVFHSFFRGEAL